MDVRASHGVGPLVDDEAEDLALASAARSQYLISTIPSLEPDRRTRSALRCQELLLAERTRASVDHWAVGRRASMSGRLAVTNERLILLRRRPVTLAALEELDEISLIARRLQVILTTGVCFAIRAFRPGLLQVELAEARAQWSDRQAERPEIEPSALRGVLPRR